MRTKKEFARFIDIALGSLIEVKTSFIVAKDLNYVRRKDIDQLMNKIDELFFKLIKLKKYLKR